MIESTIAVIIEKAQIMFDNKEILNYNKTNNIILFKK